MFDLEGRIALVTGAGRGIGKATARILAQRGMRVAVNDVDPKLVGDVERELRSEGMQVLAVPGDVTQKADVSAMVDLVEGQLGPLWLLVNNAGVFNSGPTADMSEEAWDRIFAVNAKGVFLCSQAAIRKMIPRRQGRIVTIGSIAGTIVRTGQIAYCSAKAAAIHFSRCLAVEVAPYGITVNCLCPGMTHTQMLGLVAEERGLDLEAMIELIPAGHLAKEEDHAHLVAYFAADEAAHVTGQIVAVDGAQSLYHPLTVDR